jgi:hypothetical protein
MSCVAATVLLVMGAAAIPVTAQDVRAQLQARGLPPDLVDAVAAVSLEAAGRGLPTGPLADKALEGWAKRAAVNRILIVVQSFSTRMGEAQTAVRAGGVQNPTGDVIAAAAEAIGRGMNGTQVSEMVRAGGSRADVAPALHVATALAAQGMGMDQAVIVVSAAMRQGRASDQLLDMPSLMRTMQSRGIAMPEIGRQLMQGTGTSGGGGMVGPGPGGQRPGVGNRPAIPGGMRPPGELPPPGGGRRPM